MTVPSPVNPAKIFIMWHRRLDVEHFTRELQEFDGNLVFLGSSSVTVRHNLEDPFIFEDDLPNFDPTYQRRGFKAGSMILNFLKSGDYLNHSHVGFMEYDIRVNSSGNGPLVAEALNQYVKLGSPDSAISFSTKRTLSDLEAQEEIRIKGQNAIRYLYESLPNPRSMTFEQLLSKPAVTQQSFFIRSHNFAEVVQPVLAMADNGVFESGFDTWHRPSTLLERAFAVQIALQFNKITVMDTYHHSNQDWKDNLTLRNSRRFLTTLVRRVWSKS